MFCIICNKNKTARGKKFCSVCWHSFNEDIRNKAPWVSYLVREHHKTLMRFKRKQQIVEVYMDEEKLNYAKTKENNS